MEIITADKAFWLGCVQGLSEYLPISSSGHLVFFQHLLGITRPLLFFNTVLHLGTLVAVLMFFYDGLKSIFQDSMRVLFRSKAVTFQQRLEYSKIDFPYLRVGLHVLIAILPTVLMALLFHDLVTSFFASPKAVGVFWIVMGGFLIASHHMPHGTKTLDQIKWQDALLIGLAQGFSLMPGISRTGVTILMAMALGFSRQNSAIFSFLLSIPTILGAVLFEWSRHPETLSLQLLPMGLGFFTALVTGYIALRILMQMVHHGRFHTFGYYCLILGIFTTFVFSTGGF